MEYVELFREIMHYGKFDRMPLLHWSEWPETMERWCQEGYPRELAHNPHKYFQARSVKKNIGANLDLFPLFDEEVMEEAETYRIFRDEWGVIKKDWKDKSCIPHHVDFTLKGKRDWPQFKERLQKNPARVPPEYLQRRITEAVRLGRPISVAVAPMMGWIRNWMGIENMSYLIYDHPEVYTDMVDTLADLTCWGIDEVLPLARKMGVIPEMGFGWEDICGKSGPLISPSTFDQCVAQGYRKIRNRLGDHGVLLLGIDSDGYVEPLIKNWMDAGVNLIFPVEPGTWGGTPERIRQRFGKELRMIGGFDKRVLEKDHASIDAELASHMQLMEEGGYILMPDHLITPGTPLENYQYYLECIRSLRF